MIEDLFYSVNRYPADPGVYLEIGCQSVWVCHSPSEFASVVDQINQIWSEMQKKYIGQENNNGSRSRSRALLELASILAQPATDAGDLRQNPTAPEPPELMRMRHRIQAQVEGEE